MDAVDLDEAQACHAMQQTMEVVGRRWTGAVLLALTRNARRFTEIRQMVPGISDRMLSQRLKELESHRLIQREVIATMPVQVHYTVTDMGRDLVVALEPLVSFSARHMNR